jgi:hypothetical protein
MKSVENEHRILYERSGVGKPNENDGYMVSKKSEDGKVLRK